MSDVFEYKAPQFVDFNSALDDSEDADKFFDVEEETSFKDENKENKNNNVCEGLPMACNFEKEKERTYSSGSHDTTTAVLQTSTVDDEKSSSDIKRRSILKAVRRSRSNSEVKIKIETDNDTVNDPNLEENLSQDLSNVSLRARKRTHFEGIEVKTEVEKQHCMVTRNDEKIKTPKLELRTRNVMKNDDVSRKRKAQCDKDTKAPKYMAVAEQILHFQRDTPPRFHTSRRRSSGVNGSLLKKRQSYKPRRTIALTPKLMTSMRSRPVDIPSQQQREEAEVEEMKQHQVKAIPLNEKIFLPPKLPAVQHKKTEPVPFNLTEMTKKPTQEIKEEPFKFTANPVPRTILKKPVGIGPKRELPITVPESPAITKPAWAHKRVRVSVAISNEYEEDSESIKSFGVHANEFRRKTTPKPFSFEVRDKELMEKKEKKMKEALEAEKKLREFKANPLPPFVASKNTTRASNMSLRSVCSETDEAPKPFKARSPRVLRQKPFTVVKEHVHSEPLDIKLHTDLRAIERQEFEAKKAEKEGEITGLKILMEKKKKDEEEALIAQLRKEAVHKAQPMPKFKPVPLNKRVVSKLPLTVPHSPQFSKRTRTTTECSSNSQT